MHMLGKLENDQVNTLKKKLGRGSPIHNDFSFTPSPFPSQHKVCVGGRQKWVGSLHYFELLKLAPEYNSKSDRQESKYRWSK